MFEKFFVGIPTEHLLGEGVKPEYLNDDRLGQVMDDIDKAGTSELFLGIVYNLAQRQLRKALSEQGETIPNKLGKPTANPTLRWVFQCFMAVHLVTVEGVKQIINFTDNRRHILKFLSPACQSYYLLLEPDP